MIIIVFLRKYWPLVFALGFFWITACNARVETETVLTQQVFIVTDELLVETGIQKGFTPFEVTESVSFLQDVLEKELNPGSQDFFSSIDVKTSSYVVPVESRNGLFLVTYVEKEGRFLGVVTTPGRQYAGSWYFEYSCQKAESGVDFSFYLNDLNLDSEANFDHSRREVPLQCVETVDSIFFHNMANELSVAAALPINELVPLTEIGNAVFTSLRIIYKE